MKTRRVKPHSLSLSSDVCGCTRPRGRGARGDALEPGRRLAKGSEAGSPETQTGARQASARPRQEGVRRRARERGVTPAGLPTSRCLEGPDTPGPPAAAASGDCAPEDSRALGLSPQAAPCAAWTSGLAGSLQGGRASGPATMFTWSRRRVSRRSPA